MKSFTFFVATPLAILLLSFSSVSAQLIYEVYTAGGNSGYAADFVVLSGFTPNQSVTGKSLQYRGSGTGWSTLDLTGNADALGLYRIWMAINASGAPWTPELLGGFSMTNSGNGQLALMNTTTLITTGTCPSGGTLHDLVGYTGTNGGQSACSETLSAPVINGTGTETRRRVGGIPGQDTNHNFNDFTVIPATTPLLPVQLMTFNATTVSDGIKLAWTTASETQNDYFSIERSGDGVIFNAIGEKDGNGTTTHGSSYTFTDQTPMNGNNYYRLKQVDEDKTSHYSPVRVVNFGKNEKVAVYPNPTSTGTFNIRFTAVTEASILVSLKNAAGLEMSSQIVNVYKGENFIPVSGVNIPDGPYWIAITTDAQTSVIPVQVKTN